MNLPLQTLWLFPRELEREMARRARQAALEGIARTARRGDRLARIEEPANRVAAIVAEETAPDLWRIPAPIRRPYPWAIPPPLPGSRVDARG